MLEVELTGYGGIHWHQENRDDRFTGEQRYQYCVDPAGCVCPDGSTPLGDEARQLPPDATATVALTGGLEAGSARFEVQTMEDLCTDAGEPTDDATAQVCTADGEGLAPGSRRAWQGNGCSCATLLPQASSSDEFVTEDGTHILSCLTFSVVPSVALVMSLGTPQTEAWANVSEDCDLITLPQSGLPACVKEDPALAQVGVWVLVDDDTLFWVLVIHQDGITPDLRQMAIAIADDAAVVILGG